jgi:hypothetical protein
VTGSARLKCAISASYTADLILLLHLLTIHESNESGYISDFYNSSLLYNKINHIEIEISQGKPYLFRNFYQFHSLSN